MNENIDLTKILEGCPKGTEFYSPLCGELRFEEIYIGDECPVILFSPNTALPVEFTQERDTRTLTIMVSVVYFRLKTSAIGANLPLLG